MLIIKLGVRHDILIHPVPAHFSRFDTAINGVQKFIKQSRGIRREGLVSQFNEVRLCMNKPAMLRRRNTYKREGSIVDHQTMFGASRTKFHSRGICTWACKIGT